jgi:hypothetical protein
MRAQVRQRLQKVPPPHGDALSHGMAMVAAPVTFGLIGAFVDSKAGTGPLLLILFALFGVAASFASAFYRYDSRIARHNEGKPWTRRTRRGSEAVAGRPGRRSGVDPISGSAA